MAKPTIKITHVAITPRGLELGGYSTTPRTLKVDKLEDTITDVVKAEACHPDTHCMICLVKLIPEHAHMKCPQCGRRDSCCF